MQTQQSKPDDKSKDRAQSNETGKTQSGPGSSRTGLPHQGLIFFFGILLPVLAVVFETNFHFCARYFFDPFPSLNHVLLFLLIPIANYLTLLASRRNMSAHYSFMTLAGGMALGMGAMYSLMFLPLMASSLFFIGAFGFGLLGLAPALSIPCTWLTSRNVCKMAEEHKTYFNPHQIEHIGHLIILVMVLAVELPSTLTRVYLGMAATPSTEAQGIKFLRKYGSEEVMLRACYERSGRATDIIGSLYEAGHPLPVDEARRIFYKVTGKPFNSVPIPASARATMQHALAYDPGGLNAKVEDEFDLDTDIAGETVSGFARGLSLSSSRISGKVDADAMLAEIDWEYGFANVSKYDREARSKIMLPPGAVATRAVLILNGKEHEATIMVREAARQYYRQAVMQHKEDPLLVSTAGADQLLVQCYPVHPACNMKIRVHIVCPLAFDKKGDGVTALPYFAEKNFQASVPINVNLESAMPLRITGVPIPVESYEPDAGHGASAQSNRQFLLSAAISGAERANISPLIHGARNHECHAVFCRDTFAAGSPLLERKIRRQSCKIPQRLNILIDGSVKMKDEMPEIIKGLAALPNSLPIRMVLVADEERLLCPEGTPAGSEPFKKAVMELEKFTPAGGQDNSEALMKLVTNRNDKSSAVLWIHASQPIDSQGSEKILKQYLLTSNRAQAAASQSAELPFVRLYDLQVAAGPVEILSGIDNCSAFKRIQRTGTVSDDLQQLFEAWQNASQGGGAEFEIISAPSPSEHEVGPALAQLSGYQRILSNLEKSAFAFSPEASNLAHLYHLISPVSSAVVTDDDARLTPLPKPEPDPLAEFFSPGTIEKAYFRTSRFFSEALGNMAAGSAGNSPTSTVTLPNIFGSLSSPEGGNQPFDQIVKQLNRLNSVERAKEEKSYKDQIEQMDKSDEIRVNTARKCEASLPQPPFASPCPKPQAAPLLEGYTNGTIGPCGPSQEMEVGQGWSARREKQSLDSRGVVGIVGGAGGVGRSAGLQEAETAETGRLDVLQEASNVPSRSTGPQGADATVIQGVCTAGTVRPNNFTSMMERLNVPLPFPAQQLEEFFSVVWVAAVDSLLFFLLLLALMFSRSHGKRTSRKQTKT